jgi:hypothetical protein
MPFAVCDTLQQGRVEHQTLQVPASNPAVSMKLFGLSIPSWLSSLTPSTSGSSSSSSSNAPSGTVGSPIDVSSSNSSAGSVPYACSAFLDAASLCSFDMPAAEPAGAAAAAGQVLVLVERDVVFPGCPLNSSPGHNKDNSQCIMCGELVQKNHMAVLLSTQQQQQQQTTAACMQQQQQQTTPACMQQQQQQQTTAACMQQTQQQCTKSGLVCQSALPNTQWVLHLPHCIEKPL